MKIKWSYLLLITCFYLLFNFSLFGQISQGGIPPSFYNTWITDQIDTKEISIAPYLDEIKQVSAYTKDGALYKFAKCIPVDISMSNSGTWTDLPDGGRIWRLKITGRNAHALGIYYDNFWLPEGGQLFLYNQDRTQLAGAFTSFNNGKNRLFATELLGGEVSILEYFEPKNANVSPLIHISEIAYAFRSVGFLFEKDTKGFGNAEACEVNINCSEGNNWQLQKRGVLRISVKEGSFLGWCSGSLVNNVKQDKTPYVLTADHCGGSATASDLNQWIFYFNYDAASCPNPSSPPLPIQSMTACTLIAHGGNGGNTGSDFYLVELKNSVPSTYNPFFNGWDRTNISSSNGVSIHHPAGDIKKISTYTSGLSSSTWGGTAITHWRVVWATTTNGHGVTEGGSSGSPIFDSQGRIVGTLTGGISACTNGGAGPGTGPTKPDYYGKFSYHWDQNGGLSTLRLKDWLDPENTGTTALDGVYVGIQEVELLDHSVTYPNPADDFLNIYMDGFYFHHVEIRAYNILGGLTYSYKLNDASNHIIMNVADLTSGIYLFTIQTEKGIISRKVSIAH